ncbi:ATP-dependent helicase HrpA [Nitzschia inconspicua]|uniref:ATP-dependent helicase HrpA n=1 Tax=Nitzschia inconspicua TaxID=303405 RepID=A0A9K3LPA1_9STRA|nr:ATP-dependent helicase HrpA [Nitzschia inconspicua]
MPPTLTERQKEAIVSKIQLHRVTIVVGPTGCGKSTLVPVALLEALGGPILVTQPRRLAVVAVATHVASKLSGRTNLESSSSSIIDSPSSIVGYHVGQSNHSTKNTQLLFATAGILLEELRAQGPQLLDKYKCILVDECHERSPENDLCLALIREFLAGSNKLKARLVLMSATFDHAKYQSYFAERVPQCRADGVPVVNLETAQSFQSTYENVETHYLDDSYTQNLLLVASRLSNNGMASASVLSAWKEAMRQDPDEDLHESDGRLLSQPLLLCIFSLVLTLNETETAEGVFLIFAPTYIHLEQIYEYLQQSWKSERNERQLSISVLHSSIDIEDCLRNMQQSTHIQDEMQHSVAPSRRILLASAIADSSITIPNVTCVIDTCRTLQVKWNLEKGAHSSKTIWASRSICDQRKGRTGRTNAGTVFRLLPKTYFVNKLKAHETPQLKLSDCRNELLQMLTSTAVSTKSATPTELLAKALDPPPTVVVDDATQHLINLGACDVKRGRNNVAVMTPTKIGRLLAELPFTVQDSVVVVTAGQYGLLHEMLLLKSIESTRPFPVVHHFADEQETQRALNKYYPHASGNDGNPTEISPSMAAHMSAYMFWDVEWNKGRRWTAMESFLHQMASESDQTGDRSVWKWSPEIEEAHLQWCKKYQINPTSVRAITEVMDVAIGILYKAAFEPQWLYCADTEPKWRCTADSTASDTPDDYRFRMFDRVYGTSNAALLQKLKDLSLGQKPYTERNSETTIRQFPPARVICPHFLRGNCRFGTQCRNSHSMHDPNAQRQVCRFFFVGRCSNGNSCAFAHSTTLQPLQSMIPLGGDYFAAVTQLDAKTNFLPSLGLTTWFMAHADVLCMFGEGDFSFTNALSRMGFPPALATSLDGETDTRNAFGRLCGVDITKTHLDHPLLSKINQHIGLEKFRIAVWNFPYASDDDDCPIHVQEQLIEGALLSLAHLFSTLGTLYSDGSSQPHPFNPEFGVTLQGDQLSRWSVQQAARRAGWKLKSWCHFDPKSFPGYTPRRSNGEQFPYHHPRFYLFELQHRHGSRPVEKEEECAICLMEMNDATAILLSTCRHVFCKRCLDRVVSVAAEDESRPGAVCPLCRMAFQSHHMEQRS